MLHVHSQLTSCCCCSSSITAQCLAAASCCNAARILSTLYFITGWPRRVFLKKSCFSWLRCLCNTSTSSSTSRHRRHKAGNEICTSRAAQAALIPCQIQAAAQHAGAQPAVKSCWAPSPGPLCQLTDMPAVHTVQRLLIRHATGCVRPHHQQPALSAITIDYCRLLMARLAITLMWQSDTAVATACLTFLASM